MSYHLSNDQANGIETTRQRQERQELERIGSDLAVAREALSHTPNSKRLQERVRKLNAAMNLLQYHR